MEIVPFLSGRARPGDAPGTRAEVERLLAEVAGLRAEVEGLKRVRGEDPAPPRWWQPVTLSQAAAMVPRCKDTLKYHMYKRRRTDPAPAPRRRAAPGSGFSSEWAWHELRPWMERVFNVRLPERFHGPWVAAEPEIR
jgi:hypothetical protein